MSDSPFDVMSIVREEPSRVLDGARRFSVDASILYPMVIRAIADGKRCSTPDANHYNPRIAKAKSFTQAMDDAVAECQYRDDAISQQVLVGAEVMPDGTVIGGAYENRVTTVRVPVLPCEFLPADRRSARAYVLEVARLWFTNELQHAIECPLELHITGDGCHRWRLGCSVTI